MRLVIISNRLPFTVSQEKERITFSPSVGGLATGIRTYLDGYGDKAPPGTPPLWIGWPGITGSAAQQSEISALALRDHSAFPVFIPKHTMDKFYHGFCNKTIWPLFHYFPSLTVYDPELWEQYKQVNLLFFEAALQVIQPDDTIWVHDYQMMLLPALLHKRYPKLAIGFFLHIPFPSFELFRQLPKAWRTELLNGILGADLVGFHTYDYTQYFLRCVTRILGHEHNLGRVVTQRKVTRVDTFPMGIDFDRFAASTDIPEVVKARTRFSRSVGNTKSILSVDRLDYSKGIANRLLGFDRFLATHKQWHGRISLIMIVVPSREAVDKYQNMKRQIDELVGEINGKYGTLDWSPVKYQYRSLPFSNLVALYSMSDIALVTPLRDGMNLVAKEYLASRTDNTGVLILSEMAGVSRELGEAILINPNSIQEIADAIAAALDMPIEEQIQRNTAMRTRLHQYTVSRWAGEFLTELAETRNEQNDFELQILTVDKRSRIVRAFHEAQRALLLLDYDGTLAPFTDAAHLAAPSDFVVSLLRKLSSDTHCEICIISGRDRQTLQRWLGDLPVGLVAEHGAWSMFKNEDWQLAQQIRSDWKVKILPILDRFVNRLTGSYIEEKEYSLVWHYRPCDPDLAALRAAELADSLVQLTANINLQVVPGNKVVEVRISGVNKGMAATQWIRREPFDFIMAVGDDWTDEDMFDVLPADAFSIRVGMSRTRAKFNVPLQSDIISLLSAMTGTAAPLPMKENR